MKIIGLFMLLLSLGVLANTDFEKNKSQINQLVLQRENIIGLEFILAGPTDSNTASKWGHAMLRFIDTDDNWANDYVLSFGAYVTDKQMSKLKGVFGGYEIFPKTSNLNDFWQFYTKTQGRSITRYPLLLEKKNILYIIDELQKWTHDTTYFGNYYFTAKNCTTVLGDLLIKSGVTTYNDYSIRPSDFPKWLQQNLLAPYEPIAILNTTYTTKKLFNLINIETKDFITGTNWPGNSFEIITENFSVNEIRVIRDNMILLPQELRRKINSFLEHKQFKAYQNLLGMKAIKKSKYTINDKNTSKTIQSRYLKAIKENNYITLGIQANSSSKHFGRMRKHKDRQRLQFFKDNSPQYILLNTQEKR